MLTAEMGRLESEKTRIAGRERAAPEGLCEALVKVFHLLRRRAPAARL